MNKNTNKLETRLQNILEYIKCKYEDGGKHTAKVDFDSNFIFIFVDMNHDKRSNFFDVLTIGEFYQKYIKWIKEIPKEHAIFMAEILGANDSGAC